MQLRHAASTDTGRARDHNEDTFAIEAAPGRAEAGALFVVCDGMGGFASGEVASELAAETIKDYYYAAAAATDPGGALRDAFVEANGRVWSRGRGKMGTTGVAALFLGNTVLVANVGDSRAYLIRDGVITQLTHDHSFVAEQVSAGVLTADQARESSYRNIITRALGYRPDVEVDLYQEAVSPGDRVLLCSDGLYGPVETEEIGEVAAFGSLQRAVDRLIALANERGGPDNITAVLIEVAGAPAARVAPVPAGTGRSQSGRTARLPSAAPPQADGSTRHIDSPKGALPATTRPVPAPPPRRAPILGLIVMTLLALALLGGMFWMVLNGEATAPPSPAVPRLTAVGAPTATPAARTTAAPTLVPTDGPQRATAPPPATPGP